MDRNYGVPLLLLARRGVRYRTVVDVGCADGNFFLSFHEAGLFAGAMPVNLDANPIYEPSLKAIRDALGGYYRLCAVADHGGTVELTQAAHPYWSSIRPPQDSYWQRINGLSGERTKVPAITLDELRADLHLQPPYLLKLDVQGGECAAIRGATQFLADAHAVVCEADVEDFDAINSLLVERGFTLYDVTNLSYASDGALGWFYCTYIAKALDYVRPKAFFSTADNAAVIKVQVERRASILANNAAILARTRR